MIVYIDSSVAVGMVFGQSPAAEDWAGWERAYTSALFTVECRRMVDRLRLDGILDDHGVAHAVTAFRQLAGQIDRVVVSPAILDRASMPMPTVVKTLDAIHLATAIALRERRHPDLVFRTTDRQQARAAEALGFECRS